ncbi:MAG: helix-turn-helix domain-containing protein, partial [Collinsella sp.]|nr:helix-turn-helix domain-containing protein [Collinsella sp.]
GDALVTTEQLCMALWGTTEYIDENALQVNLTRLKKTMSALEMKQRIVRMRLFLFLVGSSGSFVSICNI